MMVSARTAVTLLAGVTVAVAGGASSNPAAAQGPSIAARALASNGDNIDVLTGVSVTLRPRDDGISFSFDWLVNDSETSPRWISGGISYVKKLTDSGNFDLRARPGIALVHVVQNDPDANTPWIGAVTADLEVSMPVVSRVSALAGLGAMWSIPFQERRRLDASGMRGRQDVLFGSYESTFFAGTISVGVLYTVPPVR